MVSPMMRRSTYTLALLVLGVLQGTVAFTSQRTTSFGLDRYVRPNTLSSLVSQTSTYELPEEFQTQFPSHQPTMVDSIASDTRGALGNLAERLSGVVRFDKEKFAKVGVSFALTYTFISNVNGSLNLSVAWYMASMRTGMSPLAPGNWKSLLAAYGGLYVFATLMRPVRVGVAMALTKKTDACLDSVQARLGSSRPQAIGVMASLAFMMWIGCAVAGLSTASALAGVPIFPN